MIEIKLDTSDWDNFLNEFIDKNKWQRKASNKTKQIMVGDIESHFDSQQSPLGKWKPRSDDYKLWLVKNGGNPDAPLLSQNSNRLKKGVKSNIKQVLKYQGGSRIYLKYQGGKIGKWAHVHNNYPDGFKVYNAFGNPKATGTIQHRQFGWISQPAQKEIIETWSRIR